MDHSPPPVIVAEGVFDQELIKSFFNLQFSKQKIKIITKASGDKRMWLKMAKRNAMINVRQKNLLEAGKTNKLDSLRVLINMPNLNRIECFDISHTMANKRLHLVWFSMIYPCRAKSIADSISIILLQVMIMRRCVKCWSDGSKE